MDLKDNIKQIDEIGKQVDKLMKLQDDAYSKLTPEQYKSVSVYHAESHEMIRGMKKGDFSGIEDLLNKYNK